MESFLVAKALNLFYVVKIQYISNNLFGFSGIRSFYVPQHVKKNDNYVFFYCSNFKIIEFDENSEIEEINLSMFRYTPNLKIMIPSNSKKIIIRIFHYNTKSKN